MKILLIKDGEILPTLANFPMRTGHLGSLLSSIHDVVWISSNFSHQEKRFIPPGIYKKYPNFPDTVLLQGFGYKSNSLRRLLHQLHFSISSLLPVWSHRPSLIYISFPTPENLLPALFGFILGAKVLLDIRDPWPLDKNLYFTSCFSHVAYVIYAGFAKLSLYGLYLLSSRVISVSPTFTTYLLPHFLRDPLKEITLPLPINKAASYCSPSHVQPNRINLLYVGTLSLSYDLVSILRYMSEVIPNFESSFSVSIVGTGPQYASLQSLKLANLRLFGWLPLQDQKVSELISKSHYGLLPMVDNGVGYMPNKIGQYLYWNLPVISSLSGISKTVIEQVDCGITYDSNDLVNSLRGKLSFSSLSFNYSRYRSNTSDAFHRLYESQNTNYDILSIVDSIVKR